MGREINGINGKADGVIIEPVREAGGNRTSDHSPSATDTRTETSGGGDRSGTGRTDTNGATETVKGQEVSELALLTDEEKAQYKAGDEAEKKRLIRNAKKRQRYAEKKKENGGEVKPRKVKGSKKDPEPVLNVDALNMVVASVFGVIASRPNCEHWLLNEKEINSITVPLSKMMAESQAFANMGQYSNQIALCMACITVFMPRLIVTVQKNKEVKKRARTGQNTDTVVRDERITDAGKEKKSNTGLNRGNDKKPASNGSDNVDNVPFYGVPIC